MVNELLTRGDSTVIHQGLGFIGGSGAYSIGENKNNVLETKVSKSFSRQLYIDWRFQGTCHMSKNCFKKSSSSSALNDNTLLLQMLGSGFNKFAPS